ncbi:MAG: pyridoxal phosphate-dependent aminotransferase [Acidimicrobiales bacterium]|nr:pyridoxal phosphate-dependent aminotransferase [Acidimicrobiales bacterium]
MGRRHVASRLHGFGSTIFAEMSALAAATGAINLGQGFPDTDGPAAIAEAAVEAIRAGDNQYPPGIGIGPLREAIAAHQRRFYGLTFDPDTEVLVTAGATEALAAAFLALCEPGDEVVTFEPWYDAYTADAALAGAARKTVPLRAPTYDFDPAALRAAITVRTRFVLLNTPHNPTGKVFARDELALIAELCVEHDLLAVTDEVYEHLVFDGVHLPLAGFPGMAERTLTISSAGKTFSFTGWKVGWVVGPADLVTAVRTAKQWLTFVNGAPFQPAVALGLGLDDAVYEALAVDLREKRDHLCEGLERVGFEIRRPAATYFVTVDVRSIGEEDGVRFCRSLPERCGVAAVPSTVFYDDQLAGRSLVRFAFCKRHEVLDEAITRLKVLTA